MNELITENVVLDKEYRGISYTVVRYDYSLSTPQNLMPSDIGMLDSWHCGYVFLPEGHEFYGKHYDEIDVECHGGLTFGEKFRVKKSKNFGMWGIGFDYMHYHDNGGDPDIVEKECKKIIDQLVGVQNA